MMFGLLVAVVGLVGGGVVALSGAGIGSMLVPLLALHVDFKAAVAAASVPHLVGSALRAFRLRKAIDPPVPGGLAGEQGGFRAVALLGFDLRKEAFVATGTAIAVVVDGVRVPVYLLMQADAIAGLWGLIALGTAGFIAGTLLGGMLLGRLPEALFERIVSGIILAIGALLFAQRPG